jgi:hypothetical protein
VECSNEVWNGVFPQHDYAHARGEQLGLSGSDPAMAYQVHQSVRLFEAFAQVFGADNPRVVNVLAGQAAWDGPCRAQLAAKYADMDKLCRSLSAAEFPTCIKSAYSAD